MGTCWDDGPVDYDTWLFPDHIPLDSMEIALPQSDTLQPEDEATADDILDGSVEKAPKAKKRKRDSREVSDGYERKKNVCLYCFMRKSHLWRHQQTAHKDEEEVKAILSCENEDEKKRRISVLTNKGNFEFNKRAVKSDSGEMIVGRKSEHVPMSEYTPCPNCYLFVVKANMRQHVTTNCPAASLKDKESNPDNMATVMLKSQLLMNDGKESESGFLQKIVPRMHEDDVTVVVKNDVLIAKHGENLYEKLGDSGFPQISARVRMMGEVVQAAGRSMTDLIDGDGFEAAVSATRVVCGYDKSKVNDHTGLPTYKKASKALKIGSELKQLATLKKGVALSCKDVESVKDAEAFLYHVTHFWNTKVSSVALKNKESKKYEKKDMLPFTSDLKLFTTTMKERLESLVEKGIHSQADYIRVNKAVLSRLLVFNKRRPNELSTILLRSWNERNLYKEETVQEVNEAMGETEKTLFKELDIVMSRGKCGNKVPTLIPEDTAGPLQMLVENRNAYVAEDNKYLFANPLAKKSGHFNAGVVLKEELVGMPLSRGDLFHSTKLRKYCATTSQILEMGEFDMEVLTRHMGHDKEVHRDTTASQMQHMN